MRLPVIAAVGAETGSSVQGQPELHIETLLQTQKTGEMAGIWEARVRQLSLTTQIFPMCPQTVGGGPRGVLLCSFYPGAPAEGLERRLTLQQGHVASTCSQAVDSLGLSTKWPRPGISN